MIENVSDKEKQKRGFASMNPERRQKIASLGGKAAHQKGVAHVWDRQQAIEAGRKGGKASGNHKRLKNGDI